MLEDQVAFLLEQYLGNYVRGLSKEALKISVWRGDVELTNMQLRPEALNALKFPVRVKAGFLGSVRLKVPWSRLGQEPVLVYLDRIFILAEPATQVEGCSEDAIQEAKRSRVREMEMKLLESQHRLKSELSTSWLGSFISTVIGNIKLSITNIHIRYEDIESNPGHPFAAGLMLSKLSAVTVDDSGKETFATGGDLDRVKKSVELESLALYFDSDSSPWSLDKSWEDLHPSEWSQIFEFGTRDGSNALSKGHSYILQPVSGNAKYTKIRLDEARNAGEALQKAAVDLDDVTLSLSKDGYRDILKVADNFSIFNQRLRYAHYRPSLSVKSDPRSWWQYAYKVVTDEMKKTSGNLSWERVLRYARLRKKYVSLYASLLKADVSRLVVDDNEEIKNLDRELDIEVILQWRMLAHKFVEQSAQRDQYANQQNAKQPWWSFGWIGSVKDETDTKNFTDEDWERLNKIFAYKENTEEYLLGQQDKNLMQFYFEIHTKHNASKLVIDGLECLADLSCEEFCCNLKMYPEAKIFDLKLGSYRLLSPHGLLAESATVVDSFVGVFSYKPFDEQVDWSLVARASPCYITYVKESVDQIIAFFESSPTISQTLALETAAAVQMTLDEVKRTAQQQVSRVLNDQSRFSLDLDIAAPKVTIPTRFRPDDLHETKLLLDLGNLILRTQEIWDSDPADGQDMYLHFNLVLSDVSAFLIDGDYHWNEAPNEINLLPVIDKCGIVLKLQQIQSENPLYPSTRVAMRVPMLGFHFSPARYHRLMQVVKIFQSNESISPNPTYLWNQADFEGWLSLLTWKGVGNREAIWLRRYLRLVGPFLYIFESPTSTTYKQWFSLRGKQLHQVPTELTDGLQNILALYDSGQSHSKVLEDSGALILLCDNEEIRKTWQSRLQGAIYRASGSAALSSLTDVSSQSKANSFKGSILDVANIEKLFLAGALDELKICFSCSYENNQDLERILLNKESDLFEFRAAGGQVELSMKSGNILIGTILRSLEIEDQYCSNRSSVPRYLARSFINSTEVTESSTAGQKISTGTPLKKTESEDNFFEAPDDFDEFATPAAQIKKSLSEYFSAQSILPTNLPSLKPPSFSRIPGLIPAIELQTSNLIVKESDTFDSFVKAQMVIYDQHSPQYNNLDNRVVVTLATLTFFCHRPTVVAIMEFMNALNLVGVNDADKRNEKSSESKDKDTTIEDPNSLVEPQPAIKGLLGKGKSRIVFHLTLSMAKAQILLMNENGDTLATLSQNNLLTDIKVFTSSFSIKAALGNLKISDDSLPSSHPYFWVCDMRNPGGSSFVEIDFSSFSIDDEDYCGYDYSLVGQLSEVRIVYLNRFVQEIISYFMGLVPRSSDSVVKLKDHVTNSEKWVSKADIEGSPALKLDLSFSRPIIVMPRRTDSLDFLELDVLYITVQNEFQWIGGGKNEISAVHLEILTVKVKDINLTIGMGMAHGESIIQDVKGLSFKIHRSLRDLMHQLPVLEAAIKVEVLKAALSNREYEVITECASSNFSETPHIVPALHELSRTPTNEPRISASSASLETAQFVSQNTEAWITNKFSVAINLVELSLHSGSTRDSPLASVQASGAWLLYKSNTHEESFLFATLKGFSVFDDREGTKEEFRLAIGKSATIRDASIYDGYDNLGEPLIDSSGHGIQKDLGLEPIPSMLILDATLRKSSSNVSLCVQRPKFLVALDFLLAVVEFFVPSARNLLSNEQDKDLLHMISPIIFNDQLFTQEDPISFLSPQKPLIVDDERFEQFIYDGKGGKLYLKDGEGKILSSPSPETFIHVGSGKRLQFQNVTIVNGEYLDSCVSLGSDSTYSASEEDLVYLERENDGAVLNSNEEKTQDVLRNADDDRSTEFVMELQAIGPELTFYSTSKNIGEHLALSTKVIHARTDAFCRLIMKGDSMEMSGNILGLKMETNGIRVLEPFDVSVKYSNASGKTYLHLVASEIFMNFSFSILRLFLAIEEEISAFLRVSSKKVSVVCSQFDKVGTIEGNGNGQICAFWRPRAPSGYAIFGDCLTPMNEPPAKGVVALNASIARVKRPLSYRLICRTGQHEPEWKNKLSSKDNVEAYRCCSIWFPLAPMGYVAMGCVVSAGTAEPPLSSVLCLSASLVSSCSLKDCITLGSNDLDVANMAFWRVDNSFGSFLPADPGNMSLHGKAYDLRHMLFTTADLVSKTHKSSSDQRSNYHAPQLERSALTSGRLFEAVASFKLVWWNNGIFSQKKLSIWRPMLPQGMVYFGDIALDGFEPPNSAIVLRDAGDDTFLKAPQDYKLVGRIKKQRGTEGISLWYPEAPPGFVALGCVASKSSPTKEDFSSLRCIRSDMVTGAQFSDESTWDTSGARASEPFSLWTVVNDLGTFLVRSGFRKPPRRLALKLAGPPTSSNADTTVIDAEIKTFSAVAFDDYGGLMVPLFGMSFDGIGLSFHGSPDYLNATVSLSFVARSFNDKYDSWEPLIEPTDGFLRYQYDMNTPGASSQLRITSTQDLNLNVSVSNTNMMSQAYASWNNLGHGDESYEKKEAVSPNVRSILDVHHRRNYYIIPQNKLGQEIYIRTTEFMSSSNIIMLPSGDDKSIKVPVSKNLLDSHLKGKSARLYRSMLTAVIADAEMTIGEGLGTGEYMTAVRLFAENHSLSHVQQQSARTCATPGEYSSQGIMKVNWSEMFFFKVESEDYYIVEFFVLDVGRGEPIGIFSAPLKQIAQNLSSTSNSSGAKFKLICGDLASAKPVDHVNSSTVKSQGKIRFAVLLSSRVDVEKEKQAHTTRRMAGYVQISPTREGPWTTMKLNYAAPATCWRFGNYVIASEVTVKEGNRYVNIRSLVSITNSTDFTIDLRLKGRYPRSSRSDDEHLAAVGESDSSMRVEMDEFIELEKYVPSTGWVSGASHSQSGDENPRMQTPNKPQELSSVELPDGWEWTDAWHVDVESVGTTDGWVYTPITEELNLLKSSDHEGSVNRTRQRRWIRHRKFVALDKDAQISVGQLEPGCTIPLPLSGLVHLEVPYVLQLRPKESDELEYSWSVVQERRCQTEISGSNQELPDICVSDLNESENLLFCSPLDGSSSTSQGLWFCLNVEAKEIAKDVHADPIHDWNIIIKSPLSLAYYLPICARYAVSAGHSDGENITCSEGTLDPGRTVKIHNGDPRNTLYLSLIPHGGWELMHPPVPISHPSRTPTKFINLRSSLSGRIVQIVLEQSIDKDYLMARVIRVYVPYWISCARLPPLTLRLIDLSGRRDRRHFPVRARSDRSEKLLYEIKQEELVDGYTIASGLNFRVLGLSACISRHEGEHFGPVKELNPLSDMDGSVDLSAYDNDGKCTHILLCSKPSYFQAVPTKVVYLRPFMTFTNRVGQDLYIKLNVDDEPKILHAYDWRVSFTYSEGGPDKLQVRLVDTVWCRPLEVVKEDTIILVMRKQGGNQKFLKAEIRGYEEGSRFLIVFRLAPADGPIRIENRTSCMVIHARQSGLGEDTWIQLRPLSTRKYSWDDPYGKKAIDVRIQSRDTSYFHCVDMENSVGSSTSFREHGVELLAVDLGDIKIVRFTDYPRRLPMEEYQSSESRLIHHQAFASNQNEMQTSAAPLELIVELGVVGVSLIDQKPRELLYLHLQRVFISYLTGYDSGTASRFKLIIGHLQLDNQLPLSPMPVALTAEGTPDINHSVFKANIAVSHGTANGIQVYPHVYIRVTKEMWRLNIHEPLIWALVDFYSDLRFISTPSGSGVTEVDPEIRIELIDISEVRLKISLETAPAQRPRGVLGIWSPVLSAVGNAFKIQVHLRKVMHRSRFMRKSAIVPAIMNRIKRDLIHNPLHLIFSVDVFGVTKSTLSSLSKGFAELSTDVQFLQLRSKQVWSRRITGVGDGLVQGSEAFAQGVAFGVTGVLRKPVESARQYGVLGIAHGLGRAFLGFVVQPLSGALDFVSLTVDGIEASFMKCLDIINNKYVVQRIRNPRAIHADGVVREYNKREAAGQMVLHLAEASRRFACTDLFREPSKYAWSDYYEDHFLLPYQRIALVTNKRVILLQCLDMDRMDKKPSKILWDVPWEDILALELAKAGYQRPSHLIIHLKYFRRSENFVRLIRCNIDEDEGQEPQAVIICSSIRKMWTSYQADMKVVALKVPSSQRNVYFSCDEDGREFHTHARPLLNPRGNFNYEEQRFINHTVHFQKIWSSEQELRSRCTLFAKQVADDGSICSIWRPLCPDGYVSIGDVAHIGTHPPHVAAIYRNTNGNFTLPIGYDLVWRNCAEDYNDPLTIWLPRPPDGYLALGCVAISAFEEPPIDCAYCVNERFAEDALFEEQMVWASPDSYPWACYIYQVQCESLQFIALRQQKEQSEWRPRKFSESYTPKVSEVPQDKR